MVFLTGYSKCYVQVHIILYSSITNKIKEICNLFDYPL